MHKFELINLAAKQLNAKSYLEIGLDAGQNFKRIEIENKESVDPRPSPTYQLTSDEFFQTIPMEKKYDIIFIDGLHIRDQTIRDVENSCNHLNKNGIIFLHDCCPYNEGQQIVDGFDVSDSNVAGNGKDKKIFGDPPGIWTGDVWKAFFHFRKTRSDFYMTTVDTDFGVGLIIPNRYQELLKHGEETYKYFEEHRKSILNLISCSEYFSFINTLEKI
jgi:hypothetical protein